MKILIAALIGLLPLHCEPERPAPTAWQCSGEHRDEINALPFAYGDLTPVDTAFRLAAADCGWTPDEIEAWVPFAVYDLVAKESGGCWNLRGGQVPKGTDCLAHTNPRRVGSDSGFGQLVSVWYRGAKAPACRDVGLCSQDDIVASPYSSIIAVVYAIHHDGAHPWCYDKRSCRYHSGAKSAPKTKPGWG